MDEAAPRRVVVTGAAKGLGRAIALRCARAGADVVAGDVERPDDTEKAAEGLGGACLALAADVTRRHQVDAMMATAIERFGGIDALVCNAAIGWPEPIFDVSEQSWDRVLGVNLKGAFLCVQAALPTMIEQGSGSIVIVSSIAGRRASVTNGAHYTCSKYGLIGLARHLAIELAGSGVRVNAVAPGPVPTDLLTEHTTPDERAAIAARTPLRRLGEPEDVAEVVWFVAGPGARHMHGAVIDVNGGMH